MSRAAQGLRAWLLQRFTAIYLGVYLLVVLWIILSASGFTYSEWRGLLGNPGMGVATALTAVAILLHAWVGVRDVLIDYVHAIWLRLLLMALTALMLLASLLWTLRALSLAALGNSG